MRNNKYTSEYLSFIILNSENLKSVCDKLNIGNTSCNKNTIKKYIRLYNIDTSHFFKKNSKGEKVKKLEDILVENSDYSRTHLKERLFREGLKNRICEICEQDENWRGKKMSLILDHINGIYNDNRLENLRIVCPNCNATLETHCKGSYTDKVKKIKKSKDVKICECGVEISLTSKKCRKCSHKELRVVDRPSYNELKASYEEIGYLATGRKYGVTDNTIKRWINSYEKEREW